MLFNGIKNDLAWIAACTPLLNEAGELPLVHEIMHLQALQNITNPTLLESIVTSLSQKPLHKLSLGRYFEQLIFETLKSNDSYKIVATNLSVQGKTNTLGEIDLLFQEKSTSKIFHWELAFKYYLQKCDNPHISSFVGPAAHDTLERKIQHIKNKQLPLLRKPEAEELLNSLGISAQEIESKVLLLGQLFYSGFSEKNTNSIEIEGLHSRHRKGWWIHISEIEQLNAGNVQNFWCILNLKNWNQSARFTYFNNMPTHNTAELIEALKIHFNEQQTAVLVLQLQKTDNNFTEISRGFVVNNQWPSA